MRREKGISESNNFLTKEPSSVEFDSVLSRKYSSTVKGVLQYFHGSTGTRENCSSFNYRMSCLELFYPCISFFKVKTNSSPPFGMFLAKMVPPWNNTAFFTMASPKPVPPSFRERPLSTR